MAEYILSSSSPSGKKKATTLRIRRRRKQKVAASSSGRSSSAESAVVMDEEEEEDDDDDDDDDEILDGSANEGLERVQVRLRKAEDQLASKDEEIKELQTRVRRHGLEVGSPKVVFRKLKAFKQPSLS